jgi:excisionase family DNA binding protein
MDATQQHALPCWEPLLTSDEAGAYLRIHPKTAIRLARQKAIPAIRIGGKLWRFRRADLDSFVENHVSSARQPEE